MAVCYVETVFRDQKTGRERLKRGSGFFSKLSLEGCDDVFGVFTNNHVLGTKAEAENAKATFFYEGPSGGETIKLRPEIMFRTHKELDYTFVGVNKEDIDKLPHSIQPIPLEPEPELQKDDSIIIFQHPKGRPKEYSTEKISNIEKPFVFYKADTETGSSGSPVLTTIGLKLIAIHHKGSEEGSYNKGTLSSEVLMHLEKGTYTKPSGCFSDSQDKEIFEDAPPTKRLKGDQENGKNSSPSEEILEDLSQDIIPFWKQLGRKLKVPNAKLEEIQNDNVQYSAVKEKAFQMLMAWIDQGESTTFSELSRALQALRKNRLAQKYCISNGCKE
ncbi:hypothetical protein ACROYT_G020798 [Oculina patagonica]